MLIDIYPACFSTNSVEKSHTFGIPKYSSTQISASLVRFNELFGKDIFFLCLYMKYLKQKNTVHCDHYWALSPHFTTSISMNTFSIYIIFKVSSYNQKSHTNIYNNYTYPHFLWKSTSLLRFLQTFQYYNGFRVVHDHMILAVKVM